ncbi:uncharacterized protein VNE69_07053 [Vairimorpha necatrix]|uniref:Uncharacterized protein n=1 Tax=Vairimorpha necatrix TaxID=6039 RepID=A0AAX4JDD9_9MICR
MTKYCRTKNIELETFTTKYFVSDVFIDGEFVLYATLCGKIFKNNNIEKSFDSTSIQKRKNFHLQLNKYGFVSSGEDRKIVVVDNKGLWIIQETRNYVIKCYIYKSFVGTINKNGEVKIYYNRQLIKTLYYGPQCTNSLAFCGSKILLGLTSGQIFTHDLPETDFKLVDKNFIIEKIKEMDCNAEIYDNKQKTAASHNEKKPKKYQIMGNTINVLKNNLPHYTIKCTKPITYTKGFVGTKNGWLISNKTAYKISEDQINKIEKTHRFIKIHTKDKIFFVKLKFPIIYTGRCCGTYEKQSKTQNIYESKSFTATFRYKNEYSGFREISCAIRKRSYFICGTTESTVVLIKNNKIVDLLFVIGDVSSISLGSKNIYVSTLEGYLYKLKQYRKKLYIVKEVINNCKFRKFQIFKNNGKIKFIKNFDKFISRFLIKDNIFYGCTSDGILIVYNILARSTNFYKIDTTSLHSLCCNETRFFLSGDSHKIHVYDTEKNEILFSALGHSACIKYMQWTDKLYTISDDGYLKIWNADLKKIGEFNILIDRPECLVIIENLIFIFGFGVQVIDSHK